MNVNLLLLLLFLAFGRNYALRAFSVDTLMEDAKQEQPETSIATRKLTQEAINPSKPRLHKCTPKTITWSRFIIDYGGLGPAEDGFLNTAQNNLFVQDVSGLQSSYPGYFNGAISKPYVAFNGYGYQANFIRGKTWDAISISIAGAWYSGITAVFEGKLQGTVVGTVTVNNINFGIPTSVNLNLNGIDTLSVRTGGYHVAMDDLVICEKV